MKGAIEATQITPGAFIKGEVTDHLTLGPDHDALRPNPSCLLIIVKA